MHCRGFSSLPDLCSVDPTSTLPQLGQPEVSPTLPNVFWRTNSSTPHPTADENHSSKVTASCLSPGKGSEACLAGGRISFSKEGRFTILLLDVTEVEIMSTNKFLFVVEYFMNTCKIGKRQFLKGLSHVLSWL